MGNLFSNDQDKEKQNIYETIPIAQPIYEEYYLDISNNNYTQYPNIINNPNQIHIIHYHNNYRDDTNSLLTGFLGGMLVEDILDCY
tara:strand:+ start:63 stop:320 length:258 start_codon:yes stop_codon:yes gene_type:complete